jgi:hypothetical protein
LCLATNGHLLPNCAAEEPALAPGAGDELTEQQWTAVQNSVDKGLQWLATPPFQMLPIFQP